MMDHTLSKTIIITQVIEMISNKYKTTLDEARDKFYNSKTIKLLNDDETGLYSQSQLYIFSLFEKEIKETNK